MNFYYLGERDQAHASWALFELTKAGLKHVRRPELPPVMYQFFGPQPEGEMRMKSEYRPLCCTKCGRYDEDAVFETGFRDPVTIRIKGDFSHTQDRVFIISEKLLSTLRKAKVRGYETKPLGKSGWHALRVTVRVNCVEGVLKPAEPYCPVCGRSDGAVGDFEHVNQLAVPGDGNTFFTTEINWHRRLWDRDLFVTEDVVNALKEGGIKGGYCNRLWTDEEVRMADEKAKQGKKWKPPHSTVLL